MAPCVESAELLLLADEQLCSPLRRPPCRMPQGSGSTRFKLVKVALEATLQAMAGPTSELMKMNSRWISWRASTVCSNAYRCS